jgi:hypothetical protein
MADTHTSEACPVPKVPQPQVGCGEKNEVNQIIEAHYALSLSQVRTIPHQSSAQ